MRKIFTQSWLAVCIVGGLIGLVAGTALEFARRAYNEFAFRKMAREFELNGMSPPLMVDFLQPWVVPILTAIFSVIFALLINAFVGYRTASQGEVRNTEG